MSAERCKAVIDQASQTVGTLTCLTANVALHGAQGNGPTEDEVDLLARRARKLRQASDAIIKRVSSG